MTVADIETLHADPTLGDAVLDDPAWASLTGPHRRFAQRVGGAARYQSDVAPFVALADHRDPQNWRDAATLVGPSGTFAIAGSGIVPPADWAAQESPAGPDEGGAAVQHSRRALKQPGDAGAWLVNELLDGVQLVDVSLVKEPDPEAIRLTAADVPEILDLVERTRR